jgi:hypothetical protein
VSKFQSLNRISLRFFAALLGLGLLGYLVFRTGPGIVWKQVQAVGWGLALIIILGGFSQLIRTCAWRQTITYDISGLPWSRSIGGYYWLACSSHWWSLRVSPSQAVGA